MVRTVRERKALNLMARQNRDWRILGYPRLKHTTYHCEAGNERIFFRAEAITDPSVCPRCRYPLTFPDIDLPVFVIMS